jgi:hypothetical protein
MATYTDSMTQLSDRVIDAVRKADEVAVKAVSTASESIGSILPDLSGTMLERLPKPDEYVRLYFDFVERLVKTQRTYAMDVLRALHPVTEKIWHEAKVRKAA